MRKMGARTNANVPARYLKRSRSTLLRERNDAIARTVASFANSDGWKLTGPSLNQLVDAATVLPPISTPISRISDAP